MKTETSGDGSLIRIWLKPARRLPLRALDRAHLDKGQGLRGSANRGGKRQVTILSADSWREVERELGETVDPEVRRANLLVQGVDLADSRGRTLHVGDVRIRIVGETRPCRAMDEARPGLQAALSAGWRGGAYGEVLDDGDITVGDPVRLQAPDDDAAEARL